MLGVRNIFRHFEECDILSLDMDIVENILLK
jgi:hypothetical protein